MPAALLQAIHRRVAEINRSARDGQFTDRRAMLPRHARRPFWGVSCIAAGQSNALKSNPRAFEFRLFLKNRANRGYTRRAAIRPNKHPTDRKRSQHLRVRTRGLELGCALSRTNLLDLLPRDFPTWVKPEIFGLQSVEESG